MNLSQIFAAIPLILALLKKYFQISHNPAETVNIRKVPVADVGAIALPSALCLLPSMTKKRPPQGTLRN
jgi:hypothetical protein